MSELDIISNSIAIQETIGFNTLKNTNPVDHPSLISFANIVFNYMKMREKETG